MSIITRLDLTANGATACEDFVILDNNDAALDTALDGKAATSHTHGVGGTVYTIVANEEALTMGTTDGEGKMCSVTGNRYMWEAGRAKWQPLTFNQYTTGGLPTAATYNILGEGRQGHRRMQGIVALARKHCAAHIEQAARMAFDRGISSSRSIRNLVEHLAKAATPEASSSLEALIQEHHLIRPPQDYALFFETHAAGSDHHSLSNDHNHNLL